MKNLFSWIVVMVLLLGCNNSIKDAKARSIRQATNRVDDKHELAMADSQALTPTRLMVKDIALWVLMAGGVVVIVSGAGSLAYFFAGASFYTIRNMRIQQIPLDEATRQYPVLIYGNGRRSWNLNSGELKRLSDVSEADPMRIEASTKVQLAGLLPGKIIDGKITREL